MQSKVKIAGAALALIMLAGCASDFYDSRMRGYEPQMPEERFPIDVVKGSVKLRLQVVSGKLGAKERLALLRLAQDASSFSTEKVVITRPANSTRAELLAAAVTRELIANGIARDRIIHRTGANAGEVVISYRRKFAVTRECGDWSHPVNETADNRNYRDFGCAFQHNIAAQIDNPEDLQRPRPVDDPDTENRDRMMKLYRDRKDYTSQNPGGGKTTINSSLKTM